MIGAGSWELTGLGYGDPHSSGRGEVNWAGYFALRDSFGSSGLRGPEPRRRTGPRQVPATGPRTGRPVPSGAAVPWLSRRRGASQSAPGTNSTHAIASATMTAAIPPTSHRRPRGQPALQHKQTLDVVALASTRNRAPRPGQETGPGGCFPARLHQAHGPQLVGEVHRLGRRSRGSGISGERGPITVARWARMPHAGVIGVVRELHHAFRI